MEGMKSSKTTLATLGLGLLLLAGCASLSGTFGLGTSPNLRVGIVSDVHLRNEPGFDAYFLKALRWFDAKKVDAVVIPGDLTDQTMNMQLEHFKRCWDEVFAGNRRSDGAPVEPVFVTGNHDDEGAFYIIHDCDGLAPAKITGLANGRRPPDQVIAGISNAIAKARNAVSLNVPAGKARPTLAALDAFEGRFRAAGTNVAAIAALAGEAGRIQTNACALFFSEAFVTNLPAVWPRLFGEEYTSFFHKRVKGYDFIGVNWDFIGWKGDIQGLDEYMASQDLPADRPFFYIQHPHPKGTCHGDKVWGQDNGSSTNVLSKYPNAIALSGHSHNSLADERAIWQGAFTSIGCASLYYLDMVPGGEIKPPPKGTGRHGLLLDVFDDRVVVERRDFFHDEELAPKWVFPATYAAGDERPCSFEWRAAHCGIPEFPRGAAATLTVSNPKAIAAGKLCPIDVSFPLAKDGNRGGRLAEFEVRVEYEGANGVAVSKSKRVLPPNSFWARHRWGGTVTTRFNVRDLPAAGTPFRVAIRPANAFGGKGRPIYTEYVRPGAAAAKAGK